MSSIGSRARSSQAMKAPRTTAATPNAARIVGSVQPREGASMIAHTSVVRPAIESAKPGTSSRGAEGSFDSGTSQRPAVSAATTNGRLTRKTAFQLACSIRQPPATGPMAMPSPETPAHDADRLRALVGGEDGGDDRQRRGHDERAADAHEGAGGDQHLRRGGERGQAGAEAEDGEADREAALAAEAVAERAGGEQQAGEDEHVGVDDPLQLGAGAPRSLLERGERDVEDGVVEPDHEQRRGEDDEHPPAPGIGDARSGQARGSPEGEGAREE